MRYFAMIGGEQRGPYELSELAGAGVRPDTYVWCKGMADWEKAEDVADICRHFRRTLFDRMHPTAEPVQPMQPEAQREPEGNPDSADPYAEVPLRFRNIVRKSGMPPPEMREEETNYNRPPAPTLLLSVFLLFFCFPLTGFVAVYFSYKARQYWLESLKSESKTEGKLYTDEERHNLRVSAADYDRKARMWCGITFFLGLILYAFLGHKFT